MQLKNIVELCRVKQWYKNIVIFIPLIFSFNLFKLDLLLKIIFGFISLCLVSSSYYILNDIVDLEKDRHHPEKKYRPLPAEKVKIYQASTLSIILLGFSIFIAINLAKYFLYSVIFLFLFTQLYTFILKKEVYLDAIGIAINFVVKANSGIYVIDVKMSPWIIICVFFLALFLAFGKKKADILKMGDNAYKYNTVLDQYSEKVLDALLIVLFSSLLLSYTLYCVFVGGEALLITLPVAFYMVARYMEFIFDGSIIARNPEMVFGDLRMLISLSVWLVLVLIAIYF